jgi:hypothetical protein
MQIHLQAKKCRGERSNTTAAATGPIGILLIQKQGVHLKNSTLLTPTLRKPNYCVSSAIYTPTGVLGA